MINDPSYDPLRQQIHNQGYLVIQMKISQMEKIRIKGWQLHALSS